MIGFKKIHFKTKIKFSISRQYLMWVAGLLIFFSVLGISYYVYQEIMRAFSYSETVVLLKYEVSPEIYNIEDFKKILSNMEKKQDQSFTIDWSTIYNPFLRLENTSYQSESSGWPQAR